MRALIALLFILFTVVVPAFAQDTVPCDFSAATTGWVWELIGESPSADIPADRLRDPETWVAGQSWATNATNLNYFYRVLEPLYMTTYLREGENGRREIVGMIEARTDGEVVWVWMSDLAGRETSANPNAQYDWHGCAAFVVERDHAALRWLEEMAHGE